MLAVNNLALWTIQQLSERLTAVPGLISTGSM